MTYAPDKLVVNAIPLLGPLTGVGHVTAEISRRLEASSEFETEFFTPLKRFDNLDAIRKGHASARLLRLSKRVFRHLPLKGVFRRHYEKMGLADCCCGLYWEPNFIPIDAINARRVVTTVHDMSFHEHPEWHPRDRVAFFSRNFFRNIGRSDAVVAVSQFSRERFLESQTGIPEDRVHVIPCGINHECFRVLEPASVEAFKQHHRLPESFVLFVGSIEPRKNLDVLLSAYERFSPARREACPLVMVGDAGWRNKDILKRIARLGRGVRSFGYLKNADDLALMYNAASVFVYPSLYEGFGIPPLEAMACGTPVCLSSIPVFHEVYGQEAACYADPHDPDSLADTLTGLLENENLRRRLTDEGLRLAQRYTWQSAYGQYAGLFRSLLAS